MCRVEILNVVALDTNGDNQRDELIIAGIVEDCTDVKVGIFNGLPPATAEPPDGQASTAATILDVGVEAHGVVPTGNERVFTATFTLSDTTIFKGECGEVPAPTIGLLAVCADDTQCRDAIVWDEAIPCEEGRRDCPIITLTADVSNQCVETFRSVALSIVVNPSAQGLIVRVDYGDGSSTEDVALTQTAIGGGIVIGQAAAIHEYSVPGNGTAGFTITVSIVGRPECRETLDVTLDECPNGGPPPPCPVEQVRVVVFDENGEDVTAQAEDGECLPPGTYVVRADIVPQDATDTFFWSVDGLAAVPDERDVVSIDGHELTIQLSEAFHSVSVIAAGCASDGIDLRPCPRLCCPNLTGLSASCMPRCPRSTTVTFEATGVDLHCAEVFAWDFGDGTTVETNVPTTTHTYPSFAPFDASVTIVRPPECRRPRVQQETTRVSLCPPPCYCVFLAIASAFLLLLFLSLMPLIACSDPATQQVLIVVMLIVVVLLAIFLLWWLLDPCCRPTLCELVRVFVWVFSWALVVVGAIVIFGFCISALPFGLFYVLIQQVLIRIINDNRCDPGVPDIFSWPFLPCRD